MEFSLRFSRDDLRRGVPIRLLFGSHDGSIVVSTQDLLDGERLLLVETPEVKRCLVTRSSPSTRVQKKDIEHQIHLSTKQKTVKGEIEIDICSW